MFKDKISKKGFIIIVVLFLLFTIFTIIGFIVFSNTKKKVVTENKDGGSVVLNYLSDTNYLLKKEVVPTTDTVGMESSEYFDFSVDTDVDDAKKITYELSVKKVSGNVKESDIKIYLEKEDSGTYNSVLKPIQYKGLKKKTDIGTMAGSMVLLKETKDKTTKDYYRIRTWVVENSLVTNGNYQLEISVSAKAE